MGRLQIARLYRHTRLPIFFSTRPAGRADAVGMHFDAARSDAAFVHASYPLRPGCLIQITDGSFSVPF
jgi:hypothetical protein